MNAQRETRFVEVNDMEVRAGEGGRRISGYFAVYEKFSPVYGRFREKISKGFFDQALGRDDVRALFNHDESKMLGRSRSGTLRMRSDEIGLYGEIDPVPNTTTGNDVLENLRLGNLTGASFAFSLPPEGGDEWRKGDDGVWERTLRQVGSLYDLSVVSVPFYDQTAVGARAATADMERSFAKWQEAHPEPPEEPVVKPDLASERLTLAGM